MSFYSQGHAAYEKSNLIYLKKMGLCQHHRKKGECNHGKCPHSKWKKK